MKLFEPALNRVLDRYFPTFFDFALRPEWINSWPFDTSVQDIRVPSSHEPTPTEGRVTRAQLWGVEALHEPCSQTLDNLQNLRTRFMGCGQVQREQEALHEPCVLYGQFRVTYATWFCLRRFMIPMHACSIKGP
jgi:hypothetical protein